MRDYSVLGCLGWPGSLDAATYSSGYGAGVSGAVSNARLVVTVLGFQADRRGWDLGVLPVPPFCLGSFVDDSSVFFFWINSFVIIRFIYGELWSE
jgi:hypothetical protein